MKQCEYVILTRERSRQPWHDCGEGPFSEFDAAEDFARNEVGVEWLIVRVSSTEGVKPKLTAAQAKQVKQLARAVAKSSGVPISLQETILRNAAEDALSMDCSQCFAQVLPYLHFVATLGENTSYNPERKA